MGKSDPIAAIIGLKKNDQVIKYLLENTPIGIALIDSDGHYIAVNHRLASGLGYNAEEMKDMLYSDITCPLFLNLNAYQFSRILKQEIESFSIIEQCFSRYYGVLDVRVDVSAYYSEERESFNFIGLYQISLPFYKKYFSVIDSRLYQMIDGNPAPGIIITNSNGQILFSSRFTTNLLGYSEDEIVCLSLNDLVTEKHSSELLAQIRGKSSGAFFEYKLELYHKNGSLVSVETKFSIDDSDYFKNGRLLIIVFKEEPVKYINHQNNTRDNLELELLSEIRKLNNSIKLLNKDDSEKEVAKESISLSDFKLTNREREIIILFIKKKNAKEIAWELNLAEITIRKHFTNLYRKFGVASREELLLLLYKKKII